MKKMKKFAWIFMAAMTVAGFSACSNTEEDDVLPGLGGGETPDPVEPSTPSVVLTDTIYQFNNIEADYTPINELCEGWAHEIVSPSDDDRTWQSKLYTDKTTQITEKYIQATAHDSKDGNAGKEYDWWMITPALDVKNAKEKVFSFYSEIAYWKDDTKLEVWVLSAQSPDAKVAQLDPTLADNTNPGGNFQGWVASGDLDLSSYGDLVYIGFHYTAQGGKSNSTTYCIDDVAFGRKQVEHFLGEAGGVDEPDTLDPFPMGDDQADFATFNDGATATSYKTYTNASGWTAENSAIFSGNAEEGSNSSPKFAFIDSSESTIAVALNGKVTAPGKLTSPVLTGGIGTLTFNYGFPFGDNKFKMTVSVVQNGEVVKTEVIEKTGLDKYTAYGYQVNFNVAGDFQLVFENNCLSEAENNKDRVAIWNLNWTAQN